MVLDRLENAARYEALHPGCAAAFAFLRTAAAQPFQPGRIELDGARLYAIGDAQPGRGRAGARLEVHRQYIDIQLVISGAEEMGWRAAAACSAPGTAYDAAKDIAFFDDAAESWFVVPPGSFAIFFPEDAHAPLAGQGPLWKVIAKVAVQPESGKK